MVCLLYYKHPALVKPSPKAFKPSRPLHVRYGLAPSGRFYLRASSLKISLPCEETDRKAVLLALVIAALCIRVVIGTEDDFTLCIPLSGHDGHSFQIPGVEGHKAGIMYSPPLRPVHSMITSIRPLVIRCTHNFAGAMLYCSSLRMRLRRR